MSGALNVRDERASMPGVCGCRPVHGLCVEEISSFFVLGELRNLFCGNATMLDLSSVFLLMFAVLAHGNTGFRSLTK